MTCKRLMTAALLAASAHGAMAAEAADAPVRRGIFTTGPVATAAPVQFDVFLPLRNKDALDSLIEAQQTESSPDYHRWMTPSQFHAKFGPDDASLARIAAEMRRLGFQVVSTGTRSVHVAGQVRTVAAAFGAPLRTFRTAGTRDWIASDRPLTLTPALRAAGAVIPAFSPVPPARLHATVLGKTRPANRYANVGPYWFTDQKQAYDYPSSQATVNGKRLDGAGVKVGIIMCAAAQNSDVKAIFDHEKWTEITGRPAPTFKIANVNGGAGFYGAFDGCSVEASLDTQQVLGSAPGADVTLVTIPDLADNNLLAAYQAVVDENRFDIVSMSYGAIELFYFPAYNAGQDYRFILDTFDEAIKQGAAQGISWVASSGDEGGPACPSTSYLGFLPDAYFVPCIAYPASSPSVTSVGGGNLVTTADGTRRSAYVAENGFGDAEIPYDPYGIGKPVSGGYWGAGGGVSRRFKKPAYQRLVATGSGYWRTGPDVGMHVGGCPGLAIQPCGPDRSSAIVAAEYDEVANPYFYNVIGTSVSAPEFAGAIALYEQVHGRQGNFNNFLYKKASIQNRGGAKSFHRDQPGFDGYWSNTYPGKGYNYIFGNGSPILRTLFDFASLPAAGDPQTPSNP